MAAPSLPERQAALAALSRLSQRDLAKLWAKLNLGKPDKLADPLVEILDALTGKYGAAAASLAADWYDEDRAAAGAAGRFTAVPAATPDADRLGALSRWGVTPLFGANPDGALALSLVSGGLQRLVAGMGRQTVEQSVAMDPAGPRYARHASANACAFCAMLASRGPEYGESSAVSVGGRGVDLSANVPGRRGRAAGGVRSRGTQALGEKYHDDCHCVAVAVWPGQSYQPAPYVKRWEQAYIEARNTGASNTADTLAKMRESLGTN